MGHIFELCTERQRDREHVDESRDHDGSKKNEDIQREKYKVGLARVCYKLLRTCAGRPQLSCSLFLIEYPARGHFPTFDEVPRGGRASRLLARSAAVSVLSFLRPLRLRVRSVCFGLAQSHSVGLKRHFSKHMRR